MLDAVRRLLAASFLAIVVALCLWQVASGLWSGVVRRRLPVQGGARTGVAAVVHGLARAGVGLLGLALAFGVGMWWWARVRGT